MATFTGTDVNETITPAVVSPTVTRDPAGSFPSNNPDTLNGGGGNDVLDGAGGNDTIAGGTGDDSIAGGDGDDLIIWRNGDNNDVVEGGNGTDTQQLLMSDAAADNGVLIALGANAVFARTNLVPFNVQMSNVERVDFQGLGGNDSFTISTLASTTITQILFSGGAGNDTLDATATAVPITAGGGDGNHRLTGGTAADKRKGGAREDTPRGDHSDDTRHGGG